MHSLLDDTFYNDFYRRVSIFLTYYQHLFGEARMALAVMGDGAVYYRGLESMPLADSEEAREAVSFLRANGLPAQAGQGFAGELQEKFRQQSLAFADFGPFEAGRVWEGLTAPEQALLRALQPDGQGQAIVLPLIGMATLAGAMAVFWEATPSNASPELLDSSMQVLIKMCTREYESMLVFKDLDFLNEASNIELKHRYDILMHRSALHPFLASMGYADYYRVFGEQFLRYNKKILHVKEKVDRQDIKTAIISIVVDSFAHNVGAHSLTALKWWMQKRAELLEYRFRFGSGQALEGLSPVSISFPQLRALAKSHADFHKATGRQDVKPNIASLSALIKHMPSELEAEFLSFAPVLRDAQAPEEGTFRPRLPVPLDYAVWPFLEYMRDKSAFWSGVSRDIVYSGEAVSWYDLIWRDFINNPLFLGTIAHSEGIHKLQVWLSVADETGEARCQGLFAYIDLSVIDRELEQVEALYQEGRPAEASSPTPAGMPQGGPHYARYGLVRLGPQFEALRRELEGLPEAFLPNGIIGKHAFYTIIENTLRNVKHFREEYGRMQRDGIQLHLSLRPDRFRDPERGLEGEPGTLFKVGVWLQHPVLLVAPGSHPADSKPTFFRYLSRLQENIVNQYGQPNLGGNSQDKICAAMLLNNTFKSVVERDPEKAKVGYWPYVHIESQADAAYCAPGDDGCYAPPRGPWRPAGLAQAVEAYLKRFPEGTTGFITKYLYIWKAEMLKVVDEASGIDPRTENLTRFRIIASRGLSLEAARDRFRKQGVIRVVSWEGLDESGGSLYEQAYMAWLREWLGWRPGMRIEALLAVRDAPAGLAVLDGGGALHWRHYEDLYGNWSGEGFSGRRLELAHGQQQRASGPVCEVRSHGAFLKHFFGGAGFEGLARHRFSDASRLMELAEAWLTCISIIDNRIFMRIPDEKRRVLAEQLGLYLYPEQDEVWHRERANMLARRNFLILHLSFIESFEGQRYTAQELGEFVEQEIGPVRELPENFIVVITTGRGRSGWLESIEDPKITFRPIESLVDALEDGLSMQDLFQVKYNLMKVLMGS